MLFLLSYCTAAVSFCFLCAAGMCLGAQRTEVLITFLLCELDARSENSLVLTTYSRCPSSRLASEKNVCELSVFAIFLSSQTSVFVFVPSR